MSADPTKRPISLSEQLTLLKIARQAIGELISQKTESIDEEPLAISDASPLSLRSPLFVSLHTKSGELRGCVGSIKPVLPLFREVAIVASQAASADRRFRKILNGELGNIDIEISVLSPFEPFTSPAQIQIGVHGLYLVHGPARGLLLPQVAKEHGWTVSEFLKQVSLKAGLENEGWSKGSLQLFTAQVFGDKDSDD